MEFDDLALSAAVFLPIIGAIVLMAMPRSAETGHKAVALITALATAGVGVYLLSSFDHIPEPGNAKAFFALILILETGMNGTFVAQDLILFFVFFEVVLLPMYFMIGVWGGEQRQYAAIKFFLFTLFGSALMIVSFLAVFFVTGGESFAMVELANGVADRNAAGTLAMSTQVLVFGGMFLGFGI